MSSRIRETLTMERENAILIEMQEYYGRNRK